MPPTSAQANAFAQWVLTCPKIALQDYIQACFGKGSVAHLLSPWASKTEPLSAQELVSLLCALGYFEPMGARHPGACDIVTSFDDIVEVPPATFNAEGGIVPATRTLVKICAPDHRSLVVECLHGIAANLTAWESGELFSKSMQVPGFSEMFCPPGEPGPGSPTDQGVFSQVSRIVLCPGAGFDLSGRNHNPYSPALFHVKAKMWSTC